MPRVVRGYKHEDFSSLLEELKNGPAPETEPEITNQKQQKPVTDEKRRRDSLMGNKKMRFAFSAKAKVLHDRDCAYLHMVADEDFRMLPEYSDEMKHCKRCYRRALIRTALVPDDDKHLEAYVRILKLIGASSYDLKLLIVEHRGMFCGVGRDFICIRVNQDAWMIYIKQGETFLYHNSYTVNENYERTFKKGYHLQDCPGGATFRSFVRVMIGYSWDDHVTTFKEKAATMPEENS